jgi:hypothetical protein
LASGLFIIPAPKFQMPLLARQSTIMAIHTDDGRVVVAN